VATHDGAPDGTVLLGGSPLRLLRLNPQTADIVTALFEGLSIREAATSSARSIESIEGLARRLVVAGLADPKFAVTPASACDVTVVIPIRDRAERLARLLTALSNGDKHPARILVVDDGSTEDLIAVVERFADIATLVRHDTSLGPAAARNTGLSYVTTEFVAFVDSDVMPGEQWLAPLLAHFADPAMVVVAPRVMSAAGDTLIDRYEALRSPLDMGSFGGYVFPRTRLAYLPAAALVARTEEIRAHDGFDAHLRVGEDVDLVWRLVRAGKLVRYEPLSIVHHDPRPTIRTFAKQRVAYGSSSATLNRRHRGNVRPVSANRWSYAVWLLAGFGGWSGLVAAGTVAVTTASLLPKKLTVLKEPRSIGLKLALRGHLGMGRSLASATWRAWLPLLVVCSIGSRRARRVVIASAIIPSVIEWRERRPRLDPILWILMKCLDDASYCAGVWAGCLRAGNVEALLPELQNFPADE
jgi:mycofactocin glycosyltransferase